MTNCRIFIPRPVAADIGVLIRKRIQFGLQFRARQFARPVAIFEDLAFVLGVVVHGGCVHRQAGSGQYRKRK